MSASSPFTFPPTLVKEVQEVKALTDTYKTATDSTTKGAYLLVIKDKIAGLQAKAEAYSHSLTSAIASLLPL